MSEELKPKYGFFTVLTLFVGTMIGVGIFLRADKLSLLSGGNTYSLIASWVCTAMIIIPMIIIIAEISTITKKGGGIQGYVEELWGKRLGFTVGFSQSFFYLPILYVLVNYLIANYIEKVFNLESSIFLTVTICAVSATGLLLLNVLASKIAGKVQILATILKLVPIILISIASLFYHGDRIDTIVDDLNIIVNYHINMDSGFFMQTASLLPITFFALEGWIIVCVMSKEIKNVNKTLPLAMILGFVFTLLVYIIFSTSILNVATPLSLATKGSGTIDIASLLFGESFGGVINIFVLISALGVGNSVAMGLVRSPYSIATSRSFFGSKWLGTVNKKIDMPLNSAIFGLILTAFYILLPVIVDSSKNPLYFVEPIADSVVMLFVCYYVVTCIGVVKLRIQKPEINRPFKAPFIYVLLLLSVVGACYSLYGLVCAHYNNLILVACVILISLSGLVIYSFTKEKN